MSGYDDFKAKLGYGARANLFELEFVCPALVAAKSGIAPANITNDMKLLVSGFNIPGRKIGAVAAEFQGEAVKLAGDPSYEDLSFTFLNDMDYEARKIIENWIEFIVNPTTNARSNPSLYKQDIKLYHCSNAVDPTTGRKVRVMGWKLESAYPHTVADVAKTWAVATAVETSSFTVSYDRLKRINTAGDVI